MTRVFVYGTLLCGERYHALIAGERFEGAARTVAAYELIDLGAFPALIEGGATAVCGELYRVSDETLARLDELESHPELYRRVAVTLEQGGQALAYVMDRVRARGPRIPSGSWRHRDRTE